MDHELIASQVEVEVPDQDRTCCRTFKEETVKKRSGRGAMGGQGDKQSERIEFLIGDLVWFGGVSVWFERRVLIVWWDVKNVIQCADAG